MYFDPTTYFLLLQLRVFITGVLFQYIFKKYLSRKQWLSLVLLTIGCMIKQVNLDFLTNSEAENNDVEAKSSSDASSHLQSLISINFVFIMIQNLSSCLAGVYNEYLLKNSSGKDMNIYIQNVFMYVDSIVCNLLLIALTGNLVSSFQPDRLSELMKPSVLIIAVNNALIGIVTSFFLKYMNSILKTFASAIELVFTAVLCRILFAIPIHLNTVLAISIVSIAVFIYSRNPVNNTPRQTVTTKASEEEKEVLIA
jgi:solute carrier family 35 (UDP-sugar transporter), member A1/2/3